MSQDSHDSLHLLIDGQRLERGRRDGLPVMDPARGVELGEVPVATRDDLDAALDAADRAYRVWRRVPVEERAAIMRKAAALLRERMPAIARILTLENGKPLGESLWEIGFAADVIDWYAEEARRLHGKVMAYRGPMSQASVLKEPVGPVAAFAPWNVPVVLTGNKIAAAIAAGCSIVAKPAEETPGAILEYARAFHDAGLPKGVLNIVFGVPSEISTHLIASPTIRKVAFTGSTPVGKQIAALCAPQLKRVSLELGGHAAAIVFDDADIDQAVGMLSAFKFFNAGQVCFAPTRFYVHDAVHDRFVEAFAKQARSLKVGPGLDTASQMGPLTNKRRQEAISRLVDEAVSQVARVAAGGPARSMDAGFWWSPTVLVDVPDQAQAMRDEPFGPLALISRFDDLEHVVVRANATDYGLSSFVFTRSTTIRQRLVHDLDCGLIGINTCAVASPDLPFGGVKQSGYGYDYGTEGLESYYTNKSVSDLTL